MTILANVAIPSVVTHIIAMVILLLPVVLIEAGILARRHSIGYREAVDLALIANSRSTFVGLPLGYVCALAGVIPAGIFAVFLPEDIGSIIAVFLGSSVLHGGTIPHELDEVGFYVGTLLIMIPYYLITLRVERKAIAKVKSDWDAERLWSTVRIMNRVTYLLLAIPIVVGAIWAGLKLTGV